VFYFNYTYLDKNYISAMSSKVHQNVGHFVFLLLYANSKALLHFCKESHQRSFLLKSHWIWPGSFRGEVC